MLGSKFHDQFQPLVWTDERIARFWDFTSFFPQHYFTHQVGEGISNFIRSEVETPDVILDYGSGTGDFLQHLLKLGSKVSALEFSPMSVSKINATYRNESKYNGSISIEEVDQHAGMFDFLTCIEVIEHLDDKHLGVTFDNFYKLLKQGGHAMVSTPNDENLDEQLVYCAGCGTYFHRWQHMRSWNKASLEAYIKTKGFEIVKTYETDFSDYMPLRSKGLKRALFSLIRQMSLYLRPNSKVKKPHLVCIIKKVY
jgi:2-polyprenyl-3-methyl-5-hydroxy-6-metoxy-1,4-benzoquinol methylase